jgi:hypothetical protein
MEYFTPHNVINSRTVGNCVFYVVCSDIDLMQQYRDCWIRGDAIIWRIEQS